MLIEKKIVNEWLQESGAGEIETYYLIRAVHQAVAGHYIINYEVAKVLCRHSMQDDEFRVTHKERE